MLVKIVLLVLSSVHYGASIRCFDCNSVNNSMCLNPLLYDAETLQKFLPLVECRHGVVSGNPDSHLNFFCRKIQQTILHNQYEPEIRITRGCGWKRHHKECYKADNEDHLETVCQCFSDQCNSAHTFSVISLKMLLCVLLFLKMYL